MRIRRLGPTCFRISFPGKNRTRISVLIDPINGLKKSELEADIILLTEDKNKIDKISKHAFLIEGPGEYEIKKVFVQGIDNVYTISFKGMHICYLNDSRQKEFTPPIQKISSLGIQELSNIKNKKTGSLRDGWAGFTSQQLEKIGPIDVLIFPVKEFLNAKEMQKIVGQIEPSAIILVEPTAKKLKEKSAEFLRKMGAKEIEKEKQITLTKKDFKEEEINIIVLKTV